MSTVLQFEAMDPLRVSNAILFLLCCAGLSFQIIQISLQYFSYKTATTVMLTNENIVVAPTTVLCFDPLYIINVSDSSNRTEHKERDPSDFLTIEQMLRYSPNTSELITKYCAFRNRKGGLVVFGEENASKCYEVFSVKKFLMGGFVCYSVSRTENITITMEAMSAYTSAFWAIYNFNLGPKFENNPYMFPILHYGVEHPVDSRFFSSLIDNKVEEGRTMVVNNQIRLTNSKVETYSLFAPYDTRCVNLTVGEINSCYRDCMLKQLEINGFPNGTLTNQIYPDPGINKFILKIANEQEEDAYIRSSSVCNKTCDFSPCYKRYSITSSTATNTDNFYVLIKVRTPQYSSNSNIVIPTMSFTDYFCFASSCIGTWFGISFMSVSVIINGVYKKMKKGQSKEKIPLENRISIDHHHHIHHHNLTVRRPLFISRRVNTEF